MANWVGLVVVGLLIGTIYADQQELVKDLGLDSTDLASEVTLLQKNVTDLWTYIYQLRHAIEHHLTNLATRQTRLETMLHHSTMHSGHDHHDSDHSTHSESGHRHEPLTSSGDHHHHDDHGSSDHHHDDHGSADPHHGDHHDDHATSDHHHDEHGSSDHHHEDHGSSDVHHDDHHHHDSHSTSGDHQHGDDQHSHHSDYHEEHHHSTSDSHTHEHGNHTESDHSMEHGHDDHHHHHGDEHHDSQEKDSHGDHQHSHEHRDSHEKEDKSADEQQQQSVEDIEKPFTATIVGTHHRDHTVGQVDKPGDNRSDPLNLLGGHRHHHHYHHHHHSHRDPVQQPYEAKVTIPKYSESRLYTFATCDVQPNRVIAPELQQEVTGQVSFWQRKSGGPLNIHVRLRGFSIGDHHGHQEQQEQTNEAPVHGGGHRHGFHIHEFADLSAGCQSMGPHYNPFNVDHGGPKSAVRHVGDLGNIECDEHGITNIVFPDTVASLTGEHSILGRPLIIHSDVDDYGMNKDDPESLSTGNAGTRIACCVIQKVEKLPLSTYKAIKLATNYQN